MKEVVIIGAGPSGAICAYLLKKQGIDCLLVDFASFPRDKVCGGGLTPRAYRLLAELMPDLSYDYQGVRKFNLMIDAKTVCEFEPGEEIRMVARRDFDECLLQEYLKIGGVFINDSFSGYEVKADGSILVNLKSGRRLSCKCLVGADGANSRIRQQMFGTYGEKVLFYEQYIPKSDNKIVGDISGRYDKGYFFLFPSVGHDVVGYGERGSSKSRFRSLLARNHVPESKIMGAYIPVKEVLSRIDNILLVGDAGGFPNKLTYEGLYYAFVTARNAYRAISEGIPFAKANKAIFKHKRLEATIAWLLYNPLGRLIVRCCSVSPRLVARIFDLGVGARRK